MGTDLKLAVGIEPTASPLPRECSTTELREQSVGASPASPTHSAAGAASALPYPHGESNPGFMAENHAS